MPFTEKSDIIDHKYWSTTQHKYHKLPYNFLQKKSHKSCQKKTRMLNLIIKYQLKTNHNFNYNQKATKTWKDWL